MKGRHLRPQPRLDFVKRLRETVTVNAAIDISDGLSLDLDRLCAASGVGAELDVESIPIHPDAVELAKTSGRTPFQHAWSDGEDFELILAMSQADADRFAFEWDGFGADSNRQVRRTDRPMEKDAGEATTIVAARLSAYIEPTESFGPNFQTDFQRAMNEQEIIDLTQKLIESVVNSDWQTYTHALRGRSDGL